MLVVGVSHVVEPTSQDDFSSHLPQTLSPDLPEELKFQPVPQPSLRLDVQFSML